MNVVTKVVLLLFGTWIPLHSCQKSRSVSQMLQRAAVTAFNITTARNPIAQKVMLCDQVDTDQVGRQEFFRDRMHSDVVLVADCTLNDGSRKVFTVCCSSGCLKSFVASLPKNITRGRAVIVGASDDPYNSVPDRTNVISKSLLKLHERGVTSAFVPCQMVPGSQDRNRNHLRVFVGRDKMSGRVVSRGGDIEFSL